MQSGEEEVQQDSLAKKAGKQVTRKAVKKALKTAGKAAMKVVAHTVVGATKMLIGALLAIVGPYLLILVGVMLGIFLLYLATSLLFANDPDSLTPEGKELRQHIITVSESTIDMNSPEQWQYRVPTELIIAALQIYDSTKHGASSKEAATVMGESLAPIFTYGDYEGHIETVVETCIDDVCKTSEPSFTPFTISPLESVEAWDRQMVATVSEFTTEWETASNTRTRKREVPELDENGVPTGNIIEEEYSVTTRSSSRSKTWIVDEIVNEDYTYFDRVLTNEPFGYGQNDKIAVEAFYQATGGDIRYSEWLTNNSLIGFIGSVMPGAGVPAEFMQHYLEAEKVYKVDWYFIAAIHFIETAFSTHPTMISSVGAEGHTQFMPCTWMGWSYPGCKGSNGFVNVPDSVKYNPLIIKKHGGYGIDADKNGVASPWEIKDAIYTTASYLNKNGFSRNIDQAIRAYNHSDKYVADVKAKAMEFKNASEYLPEGGSIPALAPGTLMRPTLGAVTSTYGPRSIKGSSRKYHYGVDFGNATGTPIVAISDGIVTRVVNNCPPIGNIRSKCGGGWGNHVWVKHTVAGQSFEAVYAHFSRGAVTLNQPVKQGQLLGFMGTSGSSTGVHLHFELHAGYRNKNQNVLNPAYYIPL